MECIDFEAKRKEYLQKQLENITENELDADELDERIDTLSEQWEHLAMDWLSGKTPYEYFRQISDPAELAGIFLRYLVVGIAVPGPLTDAMLERKQELYPLLLFALKQFETETAAKEVEERVKYGVIVFFSEAQLPHPYELYLNWLIKTYEKNDLCEEIVSLFCEAGQEYVEKFYQAYYMTDSVYAQDCLIDVLSYYPGDDRIVELIGNNLLISATHRAFYANCLEKLGDPKALEFLEEALKTPDINYYDYTSIKNAIESLGGREMDVDRAFPQDKDYQRLMENEEDN